MISIRSLRAAAPILAILICCCAAQAQFGPPSTPKEPHPKATPESVEAGHKLFSGTCANCHGIDGSGANGPNIREVGATLGPEALYGIIHDGVFGSGMPSFASLSDQQIWDVIDYLTSLSHAGGALATGDAQKGKEIYASNGCASCHMIDGQGGDLGPDLSAIGEVRSVAMLKNALIDPGANLPVDTELQERANYPAYLVYRAVMKDGKVVEGMRVDEDSFTIQLRDKDGHIHSIQKFYVEKLEPEPGKSFMPSYKDKLSDAQINDLVSYLSTLGGAR